MTTERKYELIRSGKYKQLELKEKIQYWETKKHLAEYWIEKYTKELAEVEK